MAVFPFLLMGTYVYALRRIRRVKHDTLRERMHAEFDEAQ